MRVNVLEYRKKIVPLKFLYLFTNAKIIRFFVELLQVIELILDKLFIILICTYRFA